MEYEIGGASIKIIQGDITNQETDAIVNAANSTLMGGGGVDGAIHRKGGPTILEECKKLRNNKWRDGLPTGEAVITTGGDLKTCYVIHTVGPVWKGGDHGEAELLVKAYRNSLSLAVRYGLSTVAFPSISTGAYRYPIDKAAKIVLKTTSEFLKKNTLKEVTFVLYSKSDFEVYLKIAEQILRKISP